LGEKGKESKNSSNHVWRWITNFSWMDKISRSVPPQ